MLSVTMDVTLRDGGYRNGFTFSPDYALQHVKAMADAGIDWVEVGYRNGPLIKKDEVGLTGYSPGEYLRFLSGHVPAANLAVMCHPENVSCTDIYDIACSGVRMLRVCLDKGNRGETMDVVGYARRYGLKTTINITRMSLFSLDEIREFACYASDCGVDVVYLADSFGSMGPEKVAERVSFISKYVSCDIGFHAHDNLGSALINSAAARAAGAVFIDCSLMGMGKGAGNLKTEFWAKYLKDTFASNRVDFGKLLDQIAFLKNSYHEAEPVYGLNDIIAAYCDVPLDSLDRFNDNLTHPSVLIREVFRQGKYPKIPYQVL